MLNFDTFIIYKIWDISKQQYWKTPNGKDVWFTRAAAANAFRWHTLKKIKEDVNFTIHKITYIKSSVEEK
jgi:hypothetical protein